MNAFLFSENFYRGCLQLLAAALGFINCCDYSYDIMTRIQQG